MTVLCPACHIANAPKARFCRACGAALASTSAAATTQPQQETVPLATTPLPTSPAPTVSPKTAAPFAASSTTPPLAPATRAPAPLPMPWEAVLPAGDVALSLNFHRVWVAGHNATLQARVENLAAIALDEAELVLESRGLQNAVRKRVGRVGPGQAKVVLLDVQLAAAGNFVLHGEVSAVSQSVRRVFRGERVVCINEVPTGPNIVANVSVQQTTQGSGANAGLGEEKSVNIRDLVNVAHVKTLNDLLNLEMPECFLTVPVELDGEVDLEAELNVTRRAQGGLMIPEGFLATCAPGTVLRLVPVAEVPGQRVIRLNAGEALRVGRDRAEADVVTWFWPRSPENDERTRRISRVQVELKREGRTIQLLDGGSANGTYLDGEKLLNKQATTIGKVASIALGEDFQFEVERIDTAIAQGPAITNGRHWHGPEAIPLDGRVGGALRIRLPEYGARLQEVVWLFSDAAFGTSGVCPLAIEAPGLAEIQGRWHHHRGCFWLENAATAGKLSVNGQALRAGMIVPLATGMEVSLGDWRYRAEVGN